jgi:purine/pyrimidine-nucleoside phosphorylase
MFKTNEYFDGRVKSLAFNTPECPATLGVMAPGEYEFGTSSIEYMTIVSGRMSILLPDAKEWKEFKPFETFMVPKGKKFSLKIPVVSGYLCLYK